MARLINVATSFTNGGAGDSNTNACKSRAELSSDKKLRGPDKAVDYTDAGKKKTPIKFNSLRAGTARSRISRMSWRACITAIESLQQHLLAYRTTALGSVTRRVVDFQAESKTVPRTVDSVPNINLLYRIIETETQLEESIRSLGRFYFRWSLSGEKIYGRSKSTRKRSSARCRSRKQKKVKAV